MNLQTKKSDIGKGGNVHRRREKEIEEEGQGEEEE